MTIKPQSFVLIVGAATLLLGAALFIFDPIKPENCSTLTEFGPVKVCFTSSGTVVSLIGLALIIIGFAGRTLLNRLTSNHQ